MLLEAQGVSRAFGGFMALKDANLTVGAASEIGRRPDRAELRRQVDFLQLHRRRPRADPRPHPLRRHRCDAPSSRGARAPRHRAHLPGAGDVRGHDDPGERHGRRVPAPSGTAPTARSPRRREVLRLTELDGAGRPARPQPRHAGAQAPGDRARARDRAEAAAARRSARRPHPGRDPERHSAGAQDPRARHHHRDRRAHHGGDPDAGAARAGVQPREHDRARKAGGRRARPAR